MRNLFSIIGGAVAVFSILTPVHAQIYVPIDPDAKSETGKTNASTKI